MRRLLPGGRGIFRIAFAFLLWAIGFPARSEPSQAYHDLYPERPIVALTPGLTGRDFVALLDRIEAAGHPVPVAVVGAGLILDERPGLAALLTAEPAVTEILTEPAPAGVRPRSGSPATAGLLRWWNDGFENPVRAPEPVPGEEPSEPIRICAGSRNLEDELRDAGREDLLRCGGVPDEASRIHFAGGRVVCNFILPEYVDGPFWVPQAADKVRSEVLRALRWWELKSRFPGHHAPQVRLVLVDHGILSSRVDPAQGGFGGVEDSGWIGQCLDRLGRVGDCPFPTLDEFNVDMAAEYGGHWAYTQFVLNQDTFGGGGVLAYAYLGGPYTVALRGNGGLGLEDLAPVVAHEMGHIFQALDEYSQACSGCIQASGYLEVRNWNCVRCPLGDDVPCVMRSSGQYTHSDRDQMETRIHPCTYTLGQVGLWDLNENGIMDVRETRPQTQATTVLPDTLEDSRNVPIRGLAWDLPYPPANPARYPEPVTINSIRGVEFSIDGAPWDQARPLDEDGFRDREEAWEGRLPELGGGRHRAKIRAVNSVGAPDPSPAIVDLFVFDVKLERDLEVVPGGSRLAILWSIDGEDFDSVYRIHRGLAGEGAESVIGEVESTGRANEDFVFWDDTVDPGSEYDYRLVADIPGKGRKTLGLARATAYLDNPPPGNFTSVAPNPSRGAVDFTVTVPVGPSAGTNGGGDPDVPPPEDFRDGPGDGGETSSAGAVRVNRDVSLAVYDVRGRLVRDLGIFRKRETTRFNASWNGTDRNGNRVPPGIYFIRVRLDYANDVRKIVLVR
jgi:hypothetical protein